eukprot:gene11016-biopygen1101
MPDSILQDGGRRSRAPSSNSVLQDGGRRSRTEDRTEADPQTPGRNSFRPPGREDGICLSPGRNMTEPGRNMTEPARTSALEKNLIKPHISEYGARSVLQDGGRRSRTEDRTEPEF